MTKRQTSPQEVIRSLASARDRITNRDVAAQTGLTRQAVAYHLKHMVGTGELLRHGAGRGTYYTSASDFSETWPLDGLSEDSVCREVVAELPAIGEASSGTRHVVGYACTEMVNNAIDHSRGTQVRVSATISESRLIVDVIDDGIGVFRNLIEKFQVPDEASAALHLSKGKQTTMPERHSGEGIFFTSRAVDRFLIESGKTRWVADNRISDVALGDIPQRHGTRVRFEIDLDREHRLADVFERHTDADDLRFRKTELTLRLLRAGDTFLSRSEARRLLTGLEGFSEVVLDFRGVSEIGQGFADEVFRVWQRAHPGTRLVPINMSPNVEHMVRRSSANGSA